MPSESPIIWFINGACRDFGKVSGLLPRYHSLQDYTQNRSQTLNLDPVGAYSSRFFSSLFSYYYYYYYYLFFSCFSINVDDVLFISITALVPHYYTPASLTFGRCSKSNRIPPTLRRTSLTVGCSADCTLRCITRACRVLLVNVKISVNMLMG